VFLATAASVQPTRALAREGGQTDFAFPLWTQQQDGRFIVIDVDTGNYQLAPHQYNRPGTPVSFTYDSEHDLLWMLVVYYGDVYPPVPPDGSLSLAALDPHTGITEVFGGVPRTLYSLTYRPSDGKLYALTPSLDSYYPGMWVVSLDIMTTVIVPERVCTVEPVTVEWAAEYEFNNQPPINLVFEPQTDVCYYESSLSGDGGVIFQLDLKTGQSTLATGVVPDSEALAFEPVSHELFGISANHGPDPAGLWKTSFPVHPNGNSYLNIDFYGKAFVSDNLMSSIAFVPHVERD
jgi:hypothetical protein